jgi:hypothetical protein
VNKSDRGALVTDKKSRAKAIKYIRAVSIDPFKESDEEAPFSPYILHQIQKEVICQNVTPISTMCKTENLPRLLSQLKLTCLHQCDIVMPLISSKPSHHSIG